MQAAGRVLTASAPMLSEYLPVLQGLAVQAVKSKDEDRTVLFVPICMEVNASSTVAALTPAIRSAVAEPDGWRIALRATRLTVASGAPMVETVLLGDTLQDPFTAGESAESANKADSGEDALLDSALDGEPDEGGGSKTEAIGPPPSSAASSQIILRQILPACAAATGDPRVKSRLARIAANARWEVAAEAARMLSDGKEKER